MSILRQSERVILKKRKRMLALRERGNVRNGMLFLDGEFIYQRFYREPFQAHWKGENFRTIPPPPEEKGPSAICANFRIIWRLVRKVYVLKKALNQTIVGITRARGSRLILPRSSRFLRFCSLKRKTHFFVTKEKYISSVEIDFSQITITGN